MSHPLQQRVAAVGWRARSATILYAAAWLAVLAVGAALLLGLIDYLFRPRELGIQLIHSASLLVVLGLGVYFFLLPALRRRYGDVAVARRIEQRFPQLRDRLACSIEFLEQAETDPTAGSCAMRRTVIAETTATSEGLDFSTAIDARWPRRLVLWAANALRLLVIVCLLDPGSARLAATRLFAPGSAAWPRVNDLQFAKGPRQLARGTDFYAEVIDGNDRMPNDVYFEYRLAGEERLRRRKMGRLGDQVFFRLGNVSRSLEYRAIGGDDDTGWRTLTVIDPPRITDLKIQLFPPGYTGWPMETSTPEIRALKQTRIQIVAQVDKPLKAARVRLGEAQDDTIEARVENNGLRFSLNAYAKKPWILEKSGRYGFELVSHDGNFSSVTQKWKVEAIPDAPPVVTILRPRDNQTATPTASVPLELRVEDDLAIRTIELRYLHPRKSEQGEQTLLLYRRPADQRPDKRSSDKKSAEKGKEKFSQPPEQRSIDYSWELSQLEGLAPGDVISFHLAASDFLPQTTKSDPLLVRIISPDELEDRIARRQREILEQLTEILHAQEAVRGQVRVLEDRIEREGRLANDDAEQSRRQIDQLQSSELNQRQVQRRLAGPGEGLTEQIDGLLADLKSNRVDNPDLYRRMNHLRDELKRLAKEPIPDIQRSLITALKTARQQSTQEPSSENDTLIAKSLTDAGQGQDEVIAALEKLIDSYSQWDSYRRFAREISRLGRDQRQLREETGKLRPQTLGRDVKDLTNDQREELLRLSQQQHEMSRRFDRLLSRLRLQRDQLRQNDPLIAETLADAAHAADRLNIGNRIRQSSTDLEKNRLGEATRRQQQAAESLDELLDILSNRREHELGRTIKKLREAAEQLEQLRKQQEELRKQIDQSADTKDTQQQREQLERLQKQQQQAAENTKRLARQLERLQARQAAESASSAAEAQQSTAESAAEGRGENARQSARQAEQLLDETRQRLRQAIQQAERDLFQEHLAQLPQWIEGFLVRQQKIAETTAELHAQRDQQGQLPRAAIGSLDRTAQAQRLLAQEGSQLAAKVAQAEAFELGLRAATRAMSRASGLMLQQKSGDEVQQQQQKAEARLQQLLDALQEDSSQPDQDNAPPAGQNGGGNVSQQQAIRALAELKLLILMQEEVNRRTRELERLRMDKGELTETEQQEIDDLAQRQERLAQLIMNLTTPSQEGPDQQPEDLPGLPEQNQPQQDNKKSETDSLDKDLLDSLLPDDDPAAKPKHPLRPPTKP